MLGARSGRESVGHGRAAVAFAIKEPEFYVVHGCDDTGYYFSGLVVERIRMQVQRAMKSEETGLVSMAQVCRR